MAETEAGNGLQLVADTLSGDLRDALLTHVRSMENPWSKMSERDQENKINAIERMAEDVVRRAVHMIAAGEHPIVHVTVGKMTIDKGVIESKIVASALLDNIVALNGVRGLQAVLVLTDASTYMGEREAALADPDEPELPVEDPEGEEGEDAGETVDPETGEVTAAAPKPGDDTGREAKPRRRRTLGGAEMRARDAAARARGANEGTAEPSGKVENGDASAVTIPPMPEQEQAGVPAAG